MDMDLIEILRIIRRWSLIIILIVGGATGYLYTQARNAEPVYTADVTILVTTPDREDIAVFNDVNYYTTERDEIINTVNKFVEVAQYSEVEDLTQEALDITENYDLDIVTVIGSDMIVLSVTASSAELARDIANTHAEIAIDYYGDVRIGPLSEALVFFYDELEVARQDMTDAEQLLTQFRLDNGLMSVQDELNIQSSVLESLELAQTDLDLSIIVSSATIEEEPPSVLDSLLEPLPEQEVIDQMVGELVSSHRQNLRDIAVLEPEYNTLLKDVNTARDTYRVLANKYVETELRLSFANQAFFLQVIEDASLPRASENNTTQTLIFGFAGSLGLSLLIVFGLDFLIRTIRR